MPRVTCRYCAGRGTLSTAMDRCDQCDNGTVLVTDPPRPEQVTAKSVYIGNLCSMLDLQTARELSRAAANVRTWTTKRNDLIREARANGGGLREIARATGLNEGTVSNILSPRKRNGSNG